MESVHANSPLRIVLTGFMGAGKTTVGALLAQRLGWRFLDTDDQLQLLAGSSIAEIFSGMGETAFRRMEAEVFAALSQEREVVIALGGGAIETESTRLLLEASKDTRMVFLKAPLSILIDRCERQPDAAERPVLRRRETLAGRFAARLPHYERAHLTIDTRDLQPNEVADRILRSLVEYPHDMQSETKAMTI